MSNAEVLRHLRAIATSHGNAGYSEADIESEIKNVLNAGNFLNERAMLQAGAGDGTRRRIDIEFGQLVIECKKKVDPKNISQMKQDEYQLRGYLLTRLSQKGVYWTGILSDGLHWRQYRVNRNESLELISIFDIGTAITDTRQFCLWLGSALPSERDLKPSADAIESRIGSTTPAHGLVVNQLLELLDAYESSSELTLKKNLWKKMLRTAFGTNFDGGNRLLAEHTYLVILGVLIARKVIGYENLNESPTVLLSGDTFKVRGIFGVGEAGFFDWVNDLSEGNAVLYDIAKSIECFDWSDIDHDVLKVLYQSVIAPEVRKSLGEYYTPDWLADKVVSELIVDASQVRVLDPSCGSGTFLFWAIRKYFSDCESHGQSIEEAVNNVTSHVVGMDIHPVSTALAQVTYLLAIGVERLSHRSPNRPMSIPVYLGDSVRWEEPESNRSSLFASDDLVIHIADGQALFDEELRFPMEVASREDFDSLVSEIAQKASDRERFAPRPPIRNILDKYVSDDEIRSRIEATYNQLCRLRDDDRDHIWGYFIRNQAKPVLFSRPENSFDVLVGNPPWLSYRFMPEDIKKKFKERSKLRGLWSGGKMSTHQDLSAFFIATCADFYLRDGGLFAFVTPHSVLKEAHYEDFRSGRWSTPTQTLLAHFNKPVSLEPVRGNLFPVPAAVVSGKILRAGLPSPLPPGATSLQGLAPAHGGWLENQDAFTNVETSFFVKKGDQGFGSLYAERFRQGASLVPRSLIFAVEQPRDPLMRLGQIPLKSRKGNLDKSPWKDLPEITGVVEEQFVLNVFLGESILPFRNLPAERCVIPWSTGSGLMAGSSHEIDRFPGLADWWRKSEQLWESNKTRGSKLSLTDQIDYQKKLTGQFPSAPIRVVYTTSGTHLTASIVEDVRTLIDTKLYWGAVATRDEALYLCAVLNSQTLGDLVKPYQSVGQFGTRDFHRFVWMPSVPLYDSSNPSHVTLANLAKEIEIRVAELEVHTIKGFKAQRQEVRKLIFASYGEALEDLVREIVK